VRERDLPGDPDEQMQRQEDDDEDRGVRVDREARPDDERQQKQRCCRRPAPGQPGWQGELNRRAYQDSDLRADVDQAAFGHDHQDEEEHQERHC
jgi:hypothetical protein